MCPPWEWGCFSTLPFCSASGSQSHVDLQWSSSITQEGPILLIFILHFPSIVVEGKQQIKWVHHLMAVWKDLKSRKWHRSRACNSLPVGCPRGPTHPLLSRSWSSAALQMWWTGPRGQAWAHHHHLGCRLLEGFPSLRRQVGAWVSGDAVRTERWASRRPKCLGCTVAWLEDSMRGYYWPKAMLLRGIKVCFPFYKRMSLPHTRKREHDVQRKKHISHL